MNKFIEYILILLYISVVVIPPYMVIVGIIRLFKKDSGIVPKIFISVGTLIILIEIGVVYYYFAYVYTDRPNYAQNYLKPL